MQILAHDPYISAQVAAQYGARLGTLDEVCAAADYLTLHLPVTPATRHIMNAERLARCKRGIRIVNTARGELIDDAALVEALKSGQVGGAALDVFVQGAARRLDAGQPAERHRDPAHRGVHRRGAGDGGRRDRRGRS